ncbi:hypothetical protein AURDEDRAFT_164198 [Auricularia subglabra TFB-10046 SS5]|nr:hypothetical protein AURDEDRAFT_164198 [Auricularia subglabra TFB-10046 SS5]
MFSDAFRPLYAFVKLALKPLLWLYVTPASSANAFAFNGVSGARFPFQAARDRHQLAPEGHMVFVQQNWDSRFEPFSPRPVFELAYADKYSFCWMGKNSHARSMPPPPDRNGPILCACPPPVAVRMPSRFYPEAGGGVWFCPDTYTDYSPSRAFAPDLFAGCGPCAARDEPGLLTQWDPSWAERDEDDHWRFSEEFENSLIIVESSDGLIAEAVQVPFTVLPCEPPANCLYEDDLRKTWSRYVVGVQRRRADILEAVISQGRWRKLKADNDPAWRELVSEGHLRYGCVGAWFKDPLARLDILLDYYRKGLPVFYPWSAELGRRAPELSPSDALREAMQPLYEQMLPMPIPPLSRPPLVPGDSIDGRNHEGDAILVRALNEPADEGGSMVDDEPGAYGGINEETWRQAELELDEREARVGLAQEAAGPPPPPYRPVPEEGRDFVLVASLRLRVQHMDDFYAVPCKRADLYISRLVNSEADYLANVGRPRSRTTLNAAAVVLPELLTRMQPAPTPRLEADVHLVIFEGGLITRALEYALRHGLVADRTELVDFLIDNGIHFATGVEVPNPEPILTAPWHETPDNPWFDENAPVANQFETWAAVVDTLLRKPHVARAALARGGIVSMTVHALIDARFPLRPTSATLEHGSRSTVRHRDLVLHDDYLTEEEVKLILGYPEATSERSLLPSLAAFNNAYGGVVTRGIADWFQARMFELSTGFQGRTGRPTTGLRNGNEWRKALRNEVLSWYEPQPSLDGGAL